MKYISILILALIFSQQVSAQSIDDFSAPVYADPHYTGSCDPEVVFLPEQKLWLMFYTGRRPALGQSATCGNPIGVAASRDFKNWKFEGFCKFDGVGGEPDCEQTFWAPGVALKGDSLHMYVTHKHDATPPWGTGGAIAHYVTSVDNYLDGWQSREVSITEDNCLDASIVKLDNGRFRMYYVGGVNNAESKGKKRLRYAESDDLYSWKSMGELQGDPNNSKVTGVGYQEGVYVFKHNGYFYMLADPHKGLCSYSSKDGVEWKYLGRIMKGGESDRVLDWSQSRHPSVVEYDGRTFIYYHVEPFRPDGMGSGKLQTHQRYAFVQIAELVCTPSKITVLR